MADDIRERGIDLLTPVYSMLDLTPQDAMTGTRSWPTRTVHTGRHADGEPESQEAVRVIAVTVRKTRNG